MLVAKGRQTGRVGVVHWVALGAELGDGGVGVAGVPQGDGVEHQAERAELVFLAFAVALAELAAPAVADLAREPVAGLLDGELPVDGRR